MELTAAQRRRRLKKAWDHMFDRCYNPRNDRFADYGGRGIRVCEHWYKFENFYADVGDPPHQGLSIDRKDNDGNYEPGNVRWATPRQQAMNARGGPLTVIMDGRLRISQVEAAERLGITVKSIAKRMAKYRKKGITKVKYDDLKAASLKARAIWEQAALRKSWE